MGKKNPKAYWWNPRRLVDALLPPGVWSDRRKFVTKLVSGGLALTYGSVLYKLGLSSVPDVACVLPNTQIRPLQGELVAVGGVALVRISGRDSVTLRLCE